MKYFLTLLIPMAAIATIVIAAKHIASRSFRCKHCSKTFRVGWITILVTEHSGNAYRLVCPFCKAKDWCTKQPKA